MTKAHAQILAAAARPDRQKSKGMKKAPTCGASKSQPICGADLGIWFEFCLLSPQAPVRLPGANRGGHE
jgi:hypothetical protein